MVRNINHGASSSYPGRLTGSGGLLFFAADDGRHGEELWMSDATKAGTVMVKDINPCRGDSNPYSLVDAGGTVLLAADDGAHGQELWKSDGTKAGTILVRDINKVPAGTPAMADPAKSR